MTDKIAPSTPYVAPGLPRSPRVVAVAATIATLLSIVANLTGSPIVVSDEMIMLMASVAVGAFAQFRVAEREQAVGVVKLKAERDALPPGAIAADSMKGSAVLDSAETEPVRR